MVFKRTMDKAIKALDANVVEEIYPNYEVYQDGSKYLIFEKSTKKFFPRNFASIKEALTYAATHNMATPQSINKWALRGKIDMDLARKLTGLQPGKHGF